MNEVKAIGEVEEASSTYETFMEINEFLEADKTKTMPAETIRLIKRILEPNGDKAFLRNTVRKSLRVHSDVVNIYKLFLLYLQGREVEHALRVNINAIDMDRLAYNHDYKVKWENVEGLKKGSYQISLSKMLTDLGPVALLKLSLLISIVDV